MEHVTPIQISAVTRSTTDGYDAILRLTVQDPGVPAIDVRVGAGYRDAMQAIAAVISHAATRLRPHTITAGAPDKAERPPAPRREAAGSLESGPLQ